MTENKRFTVDYDITVGNYCLHDECKSKGVDGYIAYLSDEERANNLCDLLNEQEERIKGLEELIDWKKYISTETRKELERLDYENVKLAQHIRTLEKENKRLKQSKYVFGIHGGSND